MRKQYRVILLIAAVCLSPAGCGGGAGLLLSGGSVPVGGRVVTGTAVLPTGAAVANAHVTVRSVPVGTVLQTGATDSNGRFKVLGIPTSGDISIVISQPPANTLEAVVPRMSLTTNPGQPLDIGNVTALTTLVAAALHLEHGPAPEDAHSIVMNQQGHLTMQAHDAGFSVDMQNHFIDDPNSLMAQALTLLSPVANTELTAFAANPSADTASDALNGLLGYVHAPHQRDLHLSDTTRTALINKQLAGTVYTPDSVAAALNSAGGMQFTAAGVSAASQKERMQLAGLANLGTGITPFEALVIAADGNNHGGFQLDQHGMDSFLTNLLKL